MDTLKIALVNRHLPRLYGTALSGLCAVRFFLWGSLCFVGLVSVMFPVLDLVTFPTIDLRLARLIAALVGLLFLLYGFIWEAE